MGYVLRLMGGCNNFCKHCAVVEEMRKSSHTPYRELKKVIEEHKDDSIDIFGGEPTIHPEFFKIVNYMTQLKVKYMIASNCRAFSYDEFARKVSKTSIMMVRSTVYGNTPEIHDSVTTMPGSFEQTIQGFRNLKKYKIPLRVNIVMMKLNYKSLKDITKMLLEIGVDEIKYGYIILTGNADKNKDEISLSVSELRPYLNEALDLVSQTKTRFLIKKNPICIAPKYHDHFVREPDPRVDPTSVFSKGPQCDKCKFKGMCVGVSEGYKQMFGYGDLEPILK